MARAFRLHNAEKEFLDQILDKAATSVQTRDKKQCCLLARRAILADKKMLKLATATLRPVVLAKIKSEGDRFFIRLLERHARFLAMPKQQTPLFHSTTNTFTTVAKQSARFLFDNLSMLPLGLRFV